MIQLHLCSAWLGVLAGMASGAALGLFFYADGWLGGYASWPRRMLRLGHVSFFGIAFLNFAFAVTLYIAGDAPGARVASPLLIAGAVLMPAICFLAAWRKPLRHLFVLPAASLLAAGCVLTTGVLGS